MIRFARPEELLIPEVAVQHTPCWRKVLIYLQRRTFNVFLVFFMFHYGVVATSIAYSVDCKFFMCFNPVTLTLMTIGCGFFFHEEKKSKWFQNDLPPREESIDYDQKNVCCFSLLIILSFDAFGYILCGIKYEPSVNQAITVFETAHILIASFFIYYVKNRHERRIGRPLSWKESIKMIIGRGYFIRGTSRILLLAAWFLPYQFLQIRNSLYNLIFLVVYAYVVIISFVSYYASHCHRDECCQPKVTDDRANQPTHPQPQSAEEPQPSRPRTRSHTRRIEQLAESQQSNPPPVESQSRGRPKLRSDTKLRQQSSSSLQLDPEPTESSDTKPLIDDRGSTKETAV